MKLSQYSDEELSKSGYEESVDLLQQYDGSEAMTYALSPTLTMSLSLYDYDYSSSNSWCQVTVSWEWSSAPIFRLKDVVTLAWTDGMYCDTDNNLNYVIYNWYTNHDKFAGTEYGTLASDLNAGVHNYIKMERNTETYSFEYVKRGFMSIRVQKQEAVKELSFLVKYGHTTLSLNPSATISGSGASLGIRFSFGVSEAGEDDLYVNLNQ